VAAVVAFGLDITELKQSRALLDKARGEVNEVTQLKESFLENINHEFRTPITGIIGFAEILEDEVGDEQREFVNMIERNGRRLMNTLNAVLDLAGLNNDEFDLSPAVFNIVDEAKLIIDGAREMAEQKGLFLKLETSRSEVIALADQVCFARVLQNLIDNSIKFTEAGGIIVEIDGDDRGVNIRVLDTGVGIERDSVGSVFDDFNRVSGQVTGSFEGVGIGLGITKRLVELMNGSITVESQRNEGSIFSITLPRAFPVRSKHGPGKPKVLLVDDSKDVNTMIQYMLSDFFAIDRAENLRELEMHSKRNRYDVVMVDMSLMKHDLVMSGLKAVRERYEDLRIPIVGISEKKRRGEEQDSIEGFDHILDKPFKKSDLLTFMSVLLVYRDTFSEDDHEEGHHYLKAG
jgi:CheY-like chemotaxis protein/anti-sigma regulatory factor (Ser/Thr protein kinase)